MTTAESDSFDAIVIGAGPAGANAAVAASRAGLRVALVDEAAEPGGQVWRAPRMERARKAEPDGDRMRGDALREAVATAPLTHLSGTQAWLVSPGFEVAITGQQGTRVLNAPRLLVASGANERVIPFPGWTLPGVFGLAAATAIIKREKFLPGQRIVVAGQGPLLIAVAAKAISLGLKPLAVVDARSRLDWLKAFPGFASQPAQLAQGMKWLSAIISAGVPIYHDSRILAAEGKERLAALTVARNDGSRQQRLEADTLYVGNGLSPSDDIYRLMGVLQRHDEARGGHVVEKDNWGRTDIEGLYAAGDGSGIRGALPAEVSGRLAGLAMARDAGALPSDVFERESAPLLTRLKRLQPLADASCSLMRISPSQVSSIGPDTVVCRCEDIRRREIEEAAASGAQELSQLKHFTRLGMGPCQGRICAGNAAAILAESLGKPVAEVGRMTPRAPLRPIPISDLAGEFSYSDIPVPKPAPL